jgi:hypothetical protein
VLVFASLPVKNIIDIISAEGLSAFEGDYIFNLPLMKQLSRDATLVSVLGNQKGSVLVISVLLTHGSNTWVNY